MRNQRSRSKKCFQIENTLIMHGSFCAAITIRIHSLFQKLFFNRHTADLNYSEYDRLALKAGCSLQSVDNTLLHAPPTRRMHFENIRIIIVSMGDHTMKRTFFSRLLRKNPFSSIAKKFSGTTGQTQSLPIRSHPFEFLYNGQPSTETRHQKVSAVPCGSYTLSEVNAAVKKAIDDIGFIIPKGARVLIKPNVVARNTPSQCATTHPAVVDALCALCSEAGCSITIGDSSAFYQSGGTARNLVVSGMASVAKKYNARLLPFEKASLRRVSSGQALKILWITNAVYEHDLIINVPKLKVHRLAEYSGAIKNMYGCIPGGTKQIYHELFQYREDYRDFWGESLLDVYTAADPELTVMDAVYGLDRDGPAATGTPQKTGTILASSNGVVCDIAACTMIGFDPRKVPAIRAALERGSADDRSMEIVGILPSVPFNHPHSCKSSAFSDYLFHEMIMTPVVSKSECVKGCMQCATICKPGAISFDDRTSARIDYQRCIRCYCCEEQCPHGAIRLRGSVVNHIIRFIRTIKRI